MAVITQSTIHTTAALMLRTAADMGIHAHNWTDDEICCPAQSLERAVHELTRIIAEHETDQGV